MEKGAVEFITNSTSILQFSNRYVLDRIFVVCLISLISVCNVLMGCELNLHVVLSTIKRPVAPAIGFFTQFAIMPLLAYSIAIFVLSSKGMHLLALGLFVTGCSPGVMMPLWIKLLGTRLIKAVAPTLTIHIPYSKIVASLFTLIVPLFIGLIIAKYKPHWAIRARKLLRPFIISVLIVLIIFGVAINLWLFKLITWPILLAGLLLPWCGFMFGCFTSILLAQDPPDVTAIAIETGVQNTGIAIMLLKLTFPGTDSDIASLLPITVACFTPAPLLFGYAIHTLIKRLKEKRVKPGLCPADSSRSPLAKNEEEEVQQNSSTGNSDDDESDRIEIVCPTTAL
uniref:Ileal sodium/bile acid cotransporter n=1 Tax=Meloidogyne javanica TaxID=6303 RepID=A0A915MT23_MELJA